MLHCSSLTATGKQTDIEDSGTKWEKEDYTAKDNVHSD